MPWKDKEKQREAIRKHYYENRQYYIEKAYKKRAALRQYVYDLKDNTPCADCKVLYPHYVSDFDHIGGSEKVNTISRLINGGSFKKIYEELEKCELVCANCHRIRTHSRLKTNYQI